MYHQAKFYLSLVCWSSCNRNIHICPDVKYFFLCSKNCGLVYAEGCSRWKWHFCHFHTSDYHVQMQSPVQIPTDEWEKEKYLRPVNNCDDLSYTVVAYCGGSIEATLSHRVSQLTRHGLCGQGDWCIRLKLGYLKVTRERTQSSFWREDTEINGLGHILTANSRRCTKGNWQLEKALTG